MHQTFYIETDEEISSVVDKLRKSLAVDNYFVVTKRAMVVQSVVNLKLLKREAEKFKKNIVIVTVDEQVTKMAERAGIEVKASMDGLDFVEDDEIEEEDMIFQSEQNDTKQKRKRLINIGSSEYQNNYLEKNINSSFEGDECGKEIEIVSNESAAKNNDSVPKKNIRRMDDFKQIAGSSERSVSDGIRRMHSNDDTVHSSETKKERYDINKSFEAFLDPEKEEKFDKLFNKKPQEIVKQKKEEVLNIKKEENKSFVFVFSLLVLFVFAGVLAYLFIPSADIVAYLDAENKKISLNVTADNNQQALDVENLKLPARMIEKESEITLSNEATGVSESAGQKAKGTLIIYNEYGNSVQQLIATTRFETEDGKIFRIIKGVSVPGVSGVGEEKKPGVIEVEVIADAPGDEYNINATDFKIPGFKGTDKYDKIYAKSTKSMTGGGISADAAKIVSQSDIDDAKNKTEEAVINKAKSVVEGELDKDEVIISQSLKFDIIDSVSYAQVGDLKNSFDYQVKAKIALFIVSEKDLKTLIENKYRNSNKKTYEYEIGDVDIAFEDAKSNFENQSVDLRLVAQVAAVPTFDSEKFKKNLSSKNESQIKEIMGDFPQIKNLEISMEPSFLSTTPRFDSRISLEIKNYE